MRISRLTIAGVFACALALAGCGRKAEGPAAGDVTAPAGGGEEKVLNVYNWSDYIDPAIIEQFTAETGIKVNYDVFDSNEVLETKLLTGNSGYDVVVPSAYFLERQIQAGVFRKLDKSKLPNLANMDAELQQRVAEHDPGNEHAGIYMWGTTGIGYDAGKSEAIMPDAPVDSWSLIFDPKVVSRFKDCGVSVLEDPTDIVGTVLLWLGRNPNSEAQEDLDAAEAALLAIRPYIRKISSAQVIEDLANGEVCIAVGYSGDVLQAQSRAEETGQAFDIRYSIPAEGALLWFDTLAIPADAAHPDNAHAFIDFLMRPEVAAANSDFVYYANANAAATALVEEELRNNPGVYPTPQVKARLQPNLAKSADFTRLLNRAWTRFTTGQ